MLEDFFLNFLDQGFSEEECEEKAKTRFEKWSEDNGIFDN